MNANLKCGIKLFWNMNQNILSLPRHDLSIPPARLCLSLSPRLSPVHRQNVEVADNAALLSSAILGLLGPLQWERALHLRRWWFREEKSVEALWEWQLLLWSQQTWKWPQRCCALCLLERVHCLYRDLGDGEIITLIDSNLRRFKGPGMTLERVEGI